MASCRRAVAGTASSTAMLTALCQCAADRLPEAPPDAVANDCVAELLGDSEAEPATAGNALWLIHCRRSGRHMRARLAFDQKPRSGPADAAAHPQEISAGSDRFERSHRRRLALTEPAVLLGRQALAALGAPPSEHQPAALGGAASAKAVAALADQGARLIGPLHGGSPKTKIGPARRPHRGSANTPVPGL